MGGPGRGGRNIEWTRGFDTAMGEYAEPGVYVNFVAEPTAGAVEAAFGPESYARLVAAKRTYDPENLFRSNTNIPPGGYRPATMTSHEVVDEQVEGLAGIVLLSNDHHLRAAFAPGLGMVGYSLRHRDEELLGQRGGLAAYRERGSTFGIPLLHPWANRLGGTDYEAGGRTVELSPERSPVRLDGNGLPIHGVLAACPHWQVVDRSAYAERAGLVARLDYGAHPELMAAFPFPHELDLHADLAGDTLTVTTILRPTAQSTVPVAFGWHPYLHLPGVPRTEWRVDLPVRTRALLDERGLPSGAVEPVAIEPGPLGRRTYDDLFTELATPTVFVLEGGGRRIEVEFSEGYPVAQVFAPPEEPHVCFEPMTAPTNALVSGERLRFAAPGESSRATFRIRVR